MYKQSGLRVVLTVLLLTVLCISFAERAHAEGVATLYSSQGTVETQRLGNQNWEVTKTGASFVTGDKIRTRSNSRAGLKFTGGKLARLRQNSVLTIEGPKEKKKGRLSLLSGVLYLFSRKTENFPEVDTPQVSAAIRGTEFVVSTNETSTEITVLNGAVRMENSAGAVDLGAGEQGNATATSAPKKVLVLKPDNAVQWALNYPVHLDARDCPALTSDRDFAGKDKLAEGYRAAGVGDFPRAASIAENLDPKAHPCNAVYEAGVALLAGEADRATPLLATFGEPLSTRLQSTVAAHKAIIALTQNNSEAATNFATVALRLAPDSATVALAAAAVYQSQFNLDAARDTLESAVEANPDNGVLRARLAELLLGFEELHRATELAEKAVEDSSDDPYALTVLGYSHLNRYETQEAKRYFERAIAKDQLSALPYLGLGLAQIREGDLEGGRARLEEAVHLEPNVSTYRSYLGKAFFEEEDEDLAQEEFQRAIDLDPNDPTPFLYRAFNNLSKNRVISALDDVEDSIARNNNRQVYRSSLLVDQDLGVRTTSLGEIFNQLGFSQVAELEAIKSINRDYGNFSAHRLLGDTLEGDIFADAVFTQGIISDLLAPVSFNVFQDLSGFQSNASAGDYSALFDRPAHRTGIEGGYATEDTAASAKFFQTGKTGDLGYYLGYNGNYASGRKSNGDYFRFNRFDLATNYQLDYDNRVIFSSAYTSTDNGSELSGTELDDIEFSLGTHHRFGPSFEAVTRFEYFNRSARGLDTDVFRFGQQEVVLDGMSQFFTDVTLLADQATVEEVEAYRYQAQAIYDSEWFSFVYGVDVYDANGDVDESSTLTSDSTGFLSGLDKQLRSNAYFDVQSYTGYLYNTVHLSKWADVNFGVDYTSVELPAYDVIPPFANGDRSESDLSPMIGVSLYPHENSILRAVYVERLGSSNVDDIGSLRPVLAGGFVQDYGDLPGADSETYAVGFDHRWPKQVYTGVEFVSRKIGRESILGTDSIVLDFDNLTETDEVIFESAREGSQADYLNAYFYTLLSDEFAATLDYRGAQIDFADGAIRSETDRVGVAARYFSTERWFAFLQGTYRNQEINDGASSSDSFWLFDVGLGYRIPKRHGVLSLTFVNVLDESFQYDDLGLEQPLFTDFGALFQARVNF